MSTLLPETATPTELPPATRRKITDFFTREEIQRLTARSDVMGFLAVGFSWAVIVAAFAAMAQAESLPLLPKVLVFVLAATVIGGRQLALAILMHDASHGTLFKTRWLNDTFTDWVCARPIWNDLQKYRVHHFVHHTKTGQPEDTDISLVAPFPTTPASLARKFLRDIAGITGLKFFAGRFLMDAGYLKWTVANDVSWLPDSGLRPWQRAGLFLRNCWPTLVTNTLLLGALWAVGHPLLYAVWIIAYMSPFSLFVRIRSMAEHACTEKTTDMFLNTRTTRAGWLARGTVAPINVNYHIEHHVMASVPYFRLPEMHRLLRERNAVPEPTGYWDVIKKVAGAA